MRRLLLIGIITLFSSGLNAQSKSDVRIHFSENVSWFRFKTTDGTLDRTLDSKVNFGFGMNYDFIVGPGVYLRPELSFQNLGAIAQNYGEVLNWELNYMHLGFGTGYAYEKYKFQPYVGMMMYFGYMMKGYQTIGTSYLNLKEKKFIDAFDFGASLNYGLNFQFSDQVGTFIEFRNLFGLNQLETNIQDDTDQRLYNRNFSVHFGLKLSLENNNE